MWIKLIFLIFKNLKTIRDFGTFCENTVVWISDCVKSSKLKFVAQVSCWFLHHLVLATHSVPLTIEHLTPSQSPPFFVRLFGNECEYQVAKIHMPEHGNEHKQESYGKEKREHGFLFLPIFPTHPLPRATVLSMQLGTGRWSMIDPVNSMGGEGQGQGSMGSRIQPWTLNFNIIFAVSFF